MSESIVPNTDAPSADTNLFVAFDRSESGNFSILECIAQQHGFTFIVPQRVYDELTTSRDTHIIENLYINIALDRGWRHSQTTWIILIQWFGM